MKVLLMSFSLLISTTTLAFGDTVYLKDGSFLKGKITSEDDRSVVIEGGEKWQRVDKSTIEFIRKDAPGNATAAPLAADPQVPETGLPAKSGFGEAKIDRDLRIRIGSAAKATDLEFTDAGVTAPLEDGEGRNFGIGVDCGIYRDSPVGIIVSGGIFSRRHSGKDTSLSPTQVDYDAAGVELGIGIGMKPNDRVHFEGRLELGIGVGKPTLTTPGFTWNTVTASSYTSFAIMLGAYYTASQPGVQIGLELGSQAFNGGFTIRNNSGTEDESAVTGSGGVANLVVGMRF